jgi:hypothetical protein
MIFIVLFLQSWSWIFDAPHPIPSQLVEVDEGYLVQEIMLNSHPQHHPQFAGLSILLSDYGEYWMVRSVDWNNALKSDSIAMDRKTMIVDASPHFSLPDSLGVPIPIAVNYSVGLTRILQLDDTEIYQIGGKLYAARLIQYAYLDGLPLSYYDSQDESWISISSHKPKLFLYAISLSIASPENGPYVWKRKYELEQFWQSMIKKGMKESDQ